MPRGPPVESAADAIHRGCSSPAAASTPLSGRASRLPPDKPAPCRPRPGEKRLGSVRLNLRPPARVDLWPAEGPPSRMQEFRSTPTVGHLRLRDTPLP